MECYKAKKKKGPKKPQTVKACDDFGTLTVSLVSGNNRGYGAVRNNGACGPIDTNIDRSDFFDAAVFSSHLNAAFTFQRETENKTLRSFTDF